MTLKDLVKEEDQIIIDHVLVCNANIVQCYSFKCYNYGCLKGK